MNAAERLNEIRQQQLLLAVSNLMELAFEHRTLLPILVSVNPHNDDITVTVYSSKFDWSIQQLAEPLLLVSTKITSDNALLRVLEIEDQVIELIADARDKAEVPS